MERIQKALEKAQQQRVSFNRPQHFDLNSPSAKIEDIVYQETQTVKVDTQTLMANRIVAGLKNDPRSDIFRILRTKVLQRMKATNANVVAITGPTAGIGKTSIAVNLAISTAMDANYSVMLVDLDLRRPSVHRYLGLSPKFGLSDYFENNKSIGELLINPGFEKLVVLPGGKPNMNSSELLSTPQMRALISEIKHRYPNRIIIVDLPPLLGTDDAMAFIPNVDACILVTAEGENTRDEIERSLQLVDPVKLMGTILNKSSDAKFSDFY